MMALNSTHSGSSGALLTFSSGFAYCVWSFIAYRTLHGFILIKLAANKIVKAIE